MNSLNITIHSFTLLLTTLLTGLSAGILFTWANAVTTGIGRLDDISYLRAFQQMNRSILNPLFFLVFIGPAFLSIATTYLFKASSAPVYWLLVIATLLYFGGVLIVTIVGNIPLNKLLENTQLSNLNTTEVLQLRTKFESRWNTFHLIRTICSILSFTLLLLATRWTR